MKSDRKWRYICFLFPKPRVDKMPLRGNNKPDNDRIISSSLLRASGLLRSKTVVRQILICTLSVMQCYSGDCFTKKRVGFQSELAFSFTTVCRKLAGFSKSLLAMFGVSQSYLPSLTQETCKTCRDWSDPLWQKLAGFSKSRLTFLKACTHDHSLLGKRARLWKPASLWHSETPWTVFDSELS